MEAIDGGLAHRLFLAVCQFPAMRASWLQEIVGGNPGQVSRHLRRFRGHRPGGGVRWETLPVGAGHKTGRQHEPGAARHHPPPPRGPTWTRPYREHELLHNDGVNRLVVRFAREGVAGRRRLRGEVTCRA